MQKGSKAGRACHEKGQKTWGGDHSRQSKAESHSEKMGKQKKTVRGKGKKDRAKEGVILSLKQRPRCRGGEGE